MHYRPQLNLPYSNDDLEGILADALRVLARLGIACEDRGTVDRVTAAPGVTRDAGRLKFDPDVLREHVADVRQRNAALTDNEPDFEALPAWCCLNYADPETGEVRPPTTEDTVQMTRLMDARGCGDWSVPLVPADVDPRHATLTGEYVAMKHSRRLGGFMPAMDPVEIELLIEMNQAVGRTYHLVEQVSISPLRFNDLGLASALRFAGRDDVQVTLTGAIPSVGSTTPFPVRSALVETVAEGLALSLTTARLGLGQGGFGAGLQAFDFQYTTMPFGSPESMLYSAVSMQMSAFLNGRPSRFGGFRSMARRPDAQAAAERAASVLWGALLGARRFRGCGQLALDEVFSPQQAIIDDDILAHVARLIRGLDPLASGGGDPVDQIAEGLQMGTYLGQEATVRGYREFCHFPTLFHHWSVDQWRTRGEPAILAEAWDRAREQIAACEFHLPADQERALEQVYRRALREVA